MREHDAALDVRSAAWRTAIALVVLNVIGNLVAPILSSDFNSLGDAWLLVAVIVAPSALAIGAVLMVFPRTRATGRGAVLVATVATALVGLVAVIGVASLS